MPVLYGESLGQKCEGIARHQGMTVFVEGLLPQETAEVNLTDVKKSWARGKVAKLLTVSEERITPFCPVFAQCGGCHMQHLDYKAGLAWKHSYISDLFFHMGKREVDVLPVIATPHLQGVRNKMQLPFIGAGKHLAVGFYAARSHRVVVIEHCPMQSLLANKALKAMLDALRQTRYSAYDEKSAQGYLRSLVIRSNYNDSAVDITVVINGDRLDEGDNLAKELQHQLPRLSALMQNIHRNPSNSVTGEEYKVISGYPFLREEIASKRFLVSAGSFFQSNRYLTALLYETALEQAKLQSSDLVLEAYSGSGTISILMADRVAKVIAVEQNPKAVEDALLNATLNETYNTEFLTGAAEEILPDLLRGGIKPHLVLVDPPRKGCSSKLLEAIVDAKVERLVYISCNPITLVRDAGFLTDAGFRQGAIQPLDMFPWTEHIECVCSFSR